MKSFLFAFAVIGAAVPVWGDSLSLALSPELEIGTPDGVTQAVFSGTLFDSDTDDSFLFLNDISVTYEGDAGVYLSTDPTGQPPSSPNYYFTNVDCSLCGALEGDGVPSDDSYTGPIFSVFVAPGTPEGDYTGTINILGGYDGPGVDFTPLFTTAVTFDVQVVPEPGVLWLTAIGLAFLASRRGAASQTAVRALLPRRFSARRSR